MKHLKNSLTIYVWVLLFCTVHLSSASAQVQSEPACKLCGTYTGAMDSVSDVESSHIFIRLSLGLDSAYSYDIGGVFSWCNSMSFVGKGKWFADGNWLYFKPDTDHYGSSHFFLTYHAYDLATLTDLATPEQQAKARKYESIGYRFALEVTYDNSKCPLIYSYIDWDCLNLWWNRPLRKTDCK